MKEIAAALAGADQELIAAIERSESAYVLQLPGGDVCLNKGDYEITSEDMPGWLVASEGSLTIALDITRNEALIREGNARELIHPIQNLRKESDFDVTDRIATCIYAAEPAYSQIAAALSDFKDYICSKI